jgi:hypothetical protein
LSSPDHHHNLCSKLSSIYELTKETHARIRYRALAQYWTVSQLGSIGPRAALIALFH